MNPEQTFENAAVRTVMVGGSPCTVNEDEWAAATAEPGQVVWFCTRKHKTWKRGTFRMSYFYDGIIARVTEDDPDDLIEHSLFLDMGDRLSHARPEDEAS